MYASGRTWRSETTRDGEGGNDQDEDVHPSPDEWYPGCHVPPTSNIDRANPVVQQELLARTKDQGPQTPESVEGLP